MIFSRQINPIILKALAVFMLVSSCQDVETYKRGSLELAFNRNTEQTGENPLSEKSQAVFSVNAARITIGQSSPVTIDLGTQTSYSQNNLSLGSISIVVELLQNTSNNLVLYNSSKSVTILEDQTVSTTFNNWTVLNSNINITSSLNSQYSSGNSININWSNTHPELPVSIDVVDSQGSVVKNLITSFVSSSYTWTTSAEDVGTNLALRVTSSGATVTSTFFDIIEQNIVPVATSTSESMDEDTVKTFTLSATDQNSDNLTYSIVGSPSSGSITNLSGNQATYKPNDNFNGTDSFTWKANDGQLDSNTATVTITINNANDTPVSENINTNTTKNSTKTITLVATDADSDNLDYEVVSNPSNGSLGSISGANIDYTPATDFIGTDTFTYKANDGTEDSNVATVTIDVTEATIVTVISPNGGETLREGYDHTIEWTHSGSGDLVIELYQISTGENSQIASGLSAGTTSYQWTVHLSNFSEPFSPAANDFKIHVVDSSIGGASGGGDFSDSNFTIEAPIVTYPNGGEVFTLGQTVNIEWIGNWPSTNIDLYKDGSKVQAIATAMTGGGNEWAWDNINAAAGSGYKIRIYPSPTSDAAGSGEDFSDGEFTIQSASSGFTLTSPNGGETFTVGQTNSISWTGATEGGADNINIWLYKDNASPASDGAGSLGAIATSFASSGSAGSFGWNATSLIGGQLVANGSTYRVQIHNQTTGVSAYSVGDFSITGAGSVTVIAPNGGETLTNGQDYTIQWNVASTNTDIRLWQNGVVFEDFIALGIAPANASYVWNVGQFETQQSPISGTGFTIEVVDRVTGNSDFSDATFDIQSGSTPAVYVYPDIEEGYDEAFGSIIFNENSETFMLVGLSREKGDEGGGGTTRKLVSNIDSGLSNINIYSNNIDGIDMMGGYNSNWAESDFTGYAANKRSGNVGSNSFASYEDSKIWFINADSGGTSASASINISTQFNIGGVYDSPQSIGSVLQADNIYYYLSARVMRNDGTCETPSDPILLKMDSTGALMYHLAIDYEPDASKQMQWYDSGILKGEDNAFYIYGLSRRCGFSNSQQIWMFRIVDTGTSFSLEGSYNLSSKSGAPTELNGDHNLSVVQDVAADMFRFILYTGGSPGNGFSKWSINPQSNAFQYEGTTSYTTTAQHFSMTGFGEEFYVARSDGNIKVAKYNSSNMSLIWENSYDLFGTQSQDSFGGITTHNIGNGGVAITGKTRQTSSDDWDTFILLLDESGSRIE